MNQVLSVCDLYRAPQRFCLSCYLLNLKRSEHLYGISLVTFHNSVLVAVHRFTCKWLVQTSGPIAGVNNKPLKSADNNCFRSRVFWSIIISLRILLNTLICFLKGGENTSLTALCNARR